MQKLKGECESWQSALTQWLDGNIICAESKRYVSNFISIHRLRPGDHDEDAMGNPDDMVEDEDVVVTKDMLEEVLETRIGGKSKQVDEVELLGDGHHMNSTEAIGLGRDIWSQLHGVSGQVSQPSFAFDEKKVQESLQCAKSSRSKETKFAGRSSDTTRAEREAAVSNRPQATREDVEEWLRALKVRPGADGRLFVNAKQFEAVAQVATKVMEELPNRRSRAPQASEPLRWVVHGGPGTGKTHVLKKVIKEELFDQVLHWQQGLDYQVIALQAVMADLIQGDTIHHACGIPVRKKGADGDVVLQTQKEVGEKCLYWRWLLIDEFGMVGASLLAEVDMKLRDVVVDVNPSKRSSRGHAHPFGGLNVLLSGDLWQLAPPSGGFVGNIPAEFIANARKYNPKATIAHGLSLLWGGPANKDWAFHGITELEDSERCREDLWLQEVQLELRDGRLSQDNHAFLHGKATRVCGSWTDGKAVCGRNLCSKLSAKGSSWKEIEAAERHCQICSKSRQDRSRVAQDATDARFYEEKFVDAPAIFPNNDIKYDVNKQRARQYAATHKLGITWVTAKDKPLPKTLQERPDLVLQKVAWLSRHDRECGDLYGMFPLMAGLPVALTDHLDRNPQKQLLRGKLGVIHSWKCSATEDSVWEEDVRILHEFPDVVYVKFPNCTWHIEGTPEQGIYPISTVKRHWYLDKGRQYPQLAIQREQLPLAPAFSWTAHTAQGQTLKAAIVDMQIGAGTSPMSSYVAFTRVSKKEDLLIFRPFDRELFNQGNQEGPDLLLRVLRGEQIDWDAIEAKHMPSHMCAGCDTKQFKGEYSEPQWKRRDGKRYCKSCEKTLTCDGERGQCKWCGNWHTQAMFEPSVWRKKDPSQLWCKDCKEHRTCRGSCGLAKVVWEFSVGEWNHAAKFGSERGKCLKCVERNRVLKPCSSCHTAYPNDRIFYSVKMWRLGDDQRKCNKCSQAPCDSKVPTKQCSKCHKELTQTFFSEKQWFRVAERNIKCAGCCIGPQSPQKLGQWTCRAPGCHFTGDKEMHNTDEMHSTDEMPNKDEVPNKNELSVSFKKIALPNKESP